MKFINDLSYLNYKKQNTKESKITETILNFENKSTTILPQINLITTTTETTTITSTIPTTRHLVVDTTENLTEKVFTTTQLINVQFINDSILTTEQITSLAPSLDEINSSTDFDKAVSKELEITEPYETLNETITRSSTNQMNISIDYDEVFINETTILDSYSFLNTTDSNFDINTTPINSQTNISFKENDNDTFEYDQLQEKKSSYFTKAIFTSKDDLSRSSNVEEENYTAYDQTQNTTVSMELSLTSKIKTFPENSTIDMSTGINEFSNDDNLQNSFSNENFKTTKVFKESTENLFSSLILLNTDLQVLGKNHLFYI